MLCFCGFNFSGEKEEEKQREILYMQNILQQRDVGSVWGRTRINSKKRRVRNKASQTDSVPSSVDQQGDVSLLLGEICPNLISLFLLGYYLKFLLHNRHLLLSLRPLSESLFLDLITKLSFSGGVRQSLLSGFILAVNNTVSHVPLKFNMTLVI